MYTFFMLMLMINVNYFVFTVTECVSILLAVAVILTDILSVVAVNTELLVSCMFYVFTAAISTIGRLMIATSLATIIH